MSNKKKKKILPLGVEPEIIEMYDQVIAALNAESQGAKTNRTKYFTQWVKEQWFTIMAEHKIELDEHTIYFSSEEIKEDTEKLIDGYLSKGMKVDDQLVQYICERSRGYAVQKEN
jgi:hypothetical protein